MKIGYLMQAGVPNIFERPLNGPASHVIQVIKELGLLGHSVRLLFRNENQTWKSDDLVDFSPVQVRSLDKGPLHLFERVTRRIQANLHLPYGEFFESLRFAFACKQELSGYDLLYERMGWVGYGGGLASRWLKIPLVLEVNGDHVTELKSLGLEPHGTQKWLSEALMKRAAHAAAHTVATGEGWRQRHILRWGIAPSNITVIENGTTLVDLLDRDQLSSFQSNGDPEKPITLAFIGGFDPWQGLDILLRAFYQARNQGVNAILQLIGSGTVEENLKQLVKELNLTDRVQFMGKLPVSDYAPILGTADIGLSPYCGRVEFSGLKLLDYKAAGLAIIASGQDGQPTVINHGQTGWIVPPCDEDALCQAIVYLCASPETRKNLGKAARIEAEKIHSWSNTTQQLVLLFSQLVSK